MYIVMYVVYTGLEFYINSGFSKEGKYLFGVRNKEDFLV
jgi:hypothetical protein